MWVCVAQSATGGGASSGSSTWVSGSWSLAAAFGRFCPGGGGHRVRINEVGPLEDSLLET